MALPTLSLIIVSVTGTGTGTGTARRYDRSAETASKMSAVVMIHVSSVIFRLR
jgi:hypothetical protein